MTTEQLDIMTAKEVAALLRMSERFVQLAATRGDMPGVRIGRSWRFNRADILAWLKGRSNAA